jgi:predicted MFS family arabinose efflux permease
VRLASVPARLVEVVVPRRLGTNFRWLLSSTLVNNIGDGIALAAGPLLVASLTRDPFLVSMALMAQWLPMLLFGVVGGVAADRLDRRRMVVVVNLARAVVLLALVAFILTDALTIAWALVVLFGLGTAETFADSASSTLLPSLVARRDLGIANARMQGAFLLANQLVAPPIGAALFAAGMALPFAANAAAFALGAQLISRIAGSMRSERTEVGSLWADTAEGLRWLLGHPPMRTLTLTILAFNVTFGAAWGVLVLYAEDRLGLDEVGFGLLLTATAIGGVLGTVSYGALERRFRLSSLLRVGLLIETGTHLSLALTTTPAVAVATLVVFGAHAFVWGTLFTVVRQRAVPNALLGRVTGVYRVANVGGLVLGAPIGGVLARSFGITAPFWFGFLGSALLVLLLWRQLIHVAHAGEA